MSARNVVRILCTAVALIVVSGAGATTAGQKGRIAFASNRDGNSELYSIAADGSSERRLTWTSATEQSPSWSPDGTRIAYERADTNGRFHIWVMNADGSAQTQLLPDADSADDAGPAWSPDGAHIAFASTRGGTWNLWIMNGDGSGLQRLNDVFASDPSWSPDGQRLAYVGMTGIGVVNADGSNAHTITGSGGFAAGPSWSPDGRQIVFSRNDAAGYPGELYVVNADGSGETSLTSDGANHARPSWSPDGTEIVFQRTTTAPGGWTLWAVGSDGNNLRQLTSQEALGPDWGTSQAVPEPSPPDAPVIDIYSPEDGKLYLPGMDAIAFYFCSSAVSYIVSCEGDVGFGEPVDLSQAGPHTFTVRAVDGEGRTATRTVSYEVLDFTPPEIDVRTPVDGGTYDLGAPVEIDYSCADPNGTGVAECGGDRPDGAALDTSTLGAHSFTVYALDKSNNFKQTTVSYTVVDSRPPAINITSPGDGAQYLLGAQVDAQYSCKSFSGARIVACDGPVASGTRLDTASVGPHTFEVRAADEYGKSATRSHNYSVVYPFAGFDAPVDASGLLDGAKAGEPIPLKFSLQGDRGLNVVAKTTWQPASCTDWSATGAASTGQGKLTYSASSGRYVDAVASSSSWKGSCRTLTLELADGTSHAVGVRFK